MCQRTKDSFTGTFGVFICGVRVYHRVSECITGCQSVSQVVRQYHSFISILWCQTIALGVSQYNGRYQLVCSKCHTVKHGVRK